MTVRRHSTHMARVVALSCLLAGSHWLHAQEFDDAYGTLQEDIRASQQALTTAQQDISRARQALAQELTGLERDVEALRARTAARRRARDEKTLSLARLQDRLAQWETQSRYQNNQLGSFFRQVTTTGKSADDGTMARLDTYARHALHNLRPGWQQQEVADFSGNLVTVATLDIGPMHWYLSADGADAGLLQRDDGSVIARMSHALPADASQGIFALRESGSGAVTFDPTQTRAMQLRQQRESLLEHLARGGLWVIPILVFAGIALLVALAKSIQLWRIPFPRPDLQRKLDSMPATATATARREVLQAMRPHIGGQQGDLLDVAVATHPGQGRDDQLFARLNQQRQQLEQWLGTIAVIAAIAPLLGLLGTVSGMIETFKLMTLFGAGDAQAVSSGISKALITTELGLIVAIPSLLLHAILSRRIRHHCNALEADAIRLSQFDMEVSR